MISLISFLAVSVVAAAAPGMDGVNSETATAATVEPSAETVIAGTWLQSFTDARDAARKSQLPILVHFEADWCGACRTMDSAVLNQPEVLKELGQSVIGVRVNADQAPELISRFGIGSLPTEVVLDGDGRELDRFVGGASLSDYSRRLTGLRPEPVSGGESTPAEDTVADDLRECLLVKHDGKLVGLGGYSPVTMRQEKQWVRGSEDFVGTYQGVDYFFQSAEERELLFASPDHYIPRLHGCDPVELHRRNRAAAGAIELGAFYKGRLFFFLSEANRRSFQDNPAWYADAIRDEDLKQVDKSPVLQRMTLN